ncbi:MAG: bifunctional diaminohydroxyphosphoribosylaminopyrimidine deaminase/5-amino-6-(5-phosphoribosylamino)uracil reductase RibD [Bacteroidia bacterium]|nr:bifunctional diaminohydroxyphosphoribosylaminopyrimidine deaminase/5-amino-6-(5-phosphoribosylamino)uracil reductase RibD [Bacteroidia bacterium]NNC85096.1 bifunctional diaminohydroxyphosphoribosylaminopyrimidine deaminase/5-amino-6-(5-phosphoribosylamino)uracil reductase RibD [Bacteroidia bacterium]
MPSKHQKYMQRCLQLASLGLGKAQPNPMVGSVIVHDDKIIGEGFHKQFGKAHAEVNAIKSVVQKELLQESTLYVNLEPCSHYGKTPPCSEAIIKHKIPKVVIGMADPNTSVHGNGRDILKKHGVDVSIGILERECKLLNKRYLTFLKQDRPYIILKWAQSVDGFISKAPGKWQKSEKNKIYWISNTVSRVYVHKWRTEEQAIMIGTNTAKIDNPKLNVRGWKGKNPVRVVIDKDLRLPKTLNIFKKDVRTLVFTGKDKPSVKNLEYVQINFDKKPLKQILKHLHSINIQSIIIEGGYQLLNSCIEQNLWDEARVFIGQTPIGKGLEAPILTDGYKSRMNINNDQLLIYENSQ